MIDAPGWSLGCRHRDDGPGDQVHAAADVADRVTSILTAFRRHADVAPLEIAFDQVCPFHAGLGSGTQLTLAIGTALSLLRGQAVPAAADIARSLGRMKRSAIGTFGFDRGGFVVDRGQSADQSPEDRCERLRFPESWRFVLLRPSLRQGLHGAAEETFFERPDDLDAVTADRLTSLIDNEIRAALQAEDFSRFAAALASYGGLVGSYFAGAQGGIFSYAPFHALVEQLNEAGFPGAAQSSWGPSLVVPVRSTDMATAVSDVVTAFDTSAALDVNVVQVRPVGATVMRPDPGQRTFG